MNEEVYAHRGIVGHLSNGMEEEQMVAWDRDRGVCFRRAQTICSFKQKPEIGHGR